MNKSNDECIIVNSLRGIQDLLWFGKDVVVNSDLSENRPLELYCEPNNLPHTSVVSISVTPYWVKSSKTRRGYWRFEIIDLCCHAANQYWGDLIRILRNSKPLVDECNAHRYAYISEISVRRTDTWRFCFQVYLSQPDDLRSILDLEQLIRDIGFGHRMEYCIFDTSAGWSMKYLSIISDTVARMHTIVDKQNKLYKNLPCEREIRCYKCRRLHLVYEFENSTVEVPEPQITGENPQQLQLIHADYHNTIYLSTLEDLEYKHRTSNSPICVIYFQECEECEDCDVNRWLLHNKPTRLPTDMSMVYLTVVRPSWQKPPAEKYTMRVFWEFVVTNSCCNHANTCWAHMIENFLNQDPIPRNRVKKYKHVTEINVMKSFWYFEDYTDYRFRVHVAAPYTKESILEIADAIRDLGVVSRMHLIRMPTPFVRETVRMSFISVKTSDGQFHVVKHKNVLMKKKWKGYNICTSCQRCLIIQE